MREDERAALAGSTSTINHMAVCEPPGPAGCTCAAAAAAAAQQLWLTATYCIPTPGGN